MTLNFQPVDSSVDVDIVSPPLLDPTIAAKYDHSKMRKAIAHWVLMHEHPFTVVEDEGFNFMMKMYNPAFEKISRKTTKNDCIAVYDDQKKKLKNHLKGISKISITTYLWKSQNQRIEYMVITGHFVDANWRLQKRVFNFVHVSRPRRGVDIADAIYKCLKEWDLENKVFTVSVDNASYNDSCLRFLREIFSRNKKLLCDEKLFHVRCCAHILNLLVQDGLGEIGHIIENVHESVKYINQYEARKQTFSEIVQQLQLGTRKLVIDCPTHWNSTFEMLSCALKFKDVFPRFQEREPNYDYLPTPEEWEKVEKVCEVLDVFNVVTNIISGSDYPTSNLYLSEIYRVKEILNLKSMDENDFIRGMVGKMKGKFDKYWGECNLLMVVGSILDSRCKLRLIEICFPEIYSEAEARNNIEQVLGALYQLYNEYVTAYNASSEHSFTQENSSNRYSLSSSSNSQLSTSSV
ncbi:PREDICTED: zinc finger BED domain-containing protein RICESLEEPER 2-like [Nelumbo nucifera]|uniref:Zinc finger BED domain-containing protein RICESLEEPER 2-like n=2 Tax=Nelumbo nucifera TaxID=4432 RepID=A0A1U8BKF7_NELNU|nr:PREDICTED: zinc finger BED domain-containing protein RICESLEEPER 2-like [Nelumbo nucifera]DAD24379.1 TPA_asm: hypothetical protein HUJ06_025843 [Nelumbo nucifera]